MPPNDIAAIGSTFEAGAHTAYNLRPKPVQRLVWMDAFFKNLTRFFAFFVFSILAAILISLLVHSQIALSKYGFNFLFDPEWDPVAEEFGALVPIYGTLVSSAIAMIIGIPVSFGIALFLTELSPTWLKRPLGTAIEMLAAIPSIIYGMWGLFVFAPLFAEYVQPALIKTFGPLPILGPLFKGPGHGHRHADRRHHTRGHGDSVHHRGDARRVRAGAADAQGIRLRARAPRRGKSSGGSFCLIPRSASSAA